jgi:Zn-dependent protease with chaperone function
LYFPFLGFLCLALLAGAVLFLVLLERLKFPPLILFPLSFLVALGHIVWAGRCLFWKLPKGNPMELKVPRGELKGLYEFVETVAEERDLVPPDVIRQTAQEVAYVYEDAKGKKVLALGGLAVRGMTQEMLAGIVAHELGHFTAGDTALSRRSRRLGLLMAVMEAQLSHFSLESQEAQYLYLLANLNPLVWLIRGYHALFQLAWAANSRDQEFAADQLMLQQAGKQTAAASLIHTHAIEKLPWATLEAIAEMSVSLNTPVDRLFAEWAQRARRIDPGEWQEACRKALAERTGPYDSHPCLRDRLAALGLSAKQALRVPLDLSGPPATDLFDDWDALEKRLTNEVMILYYEHYAKRQEYEEVVVALAKYEARRGK